MRLLVCDPSFAPIGLRIAGGSTGAQRQRRIVGRSHRASKHAKLPPHSATPIGMTPGTVRTAYGSTT